jgi:NADPH:quinone reductase
MLADRSLSVEIGWRGRWEQFTEAVETIQGRRLTGKAVLDIGT